MLDPLGGGNQAGIHDLFVGVLFHEFGAFLDQPLHAFAGLTFGSEVQRLEYLLQAYDVSLRLFQMLLERLFQIRCRGSLGHLGEGFDQLLLGVVEVFQLLYEQVP